MKWKSIAFVAALVAVGLPALAALADWCASRPPMERPGGRGCTERSGPLASVAEPSVADLSPRQLQTLDRLLRGDSEKQIAGALKLSQATVHEYVTGLYRHFKVSSRGELMARFVGRSAPRVD